MTPIKQKGTIRNQMMIRSNAEGQVSRQKSKKFTNTDKIAAQNKGQDTDRSSVEMNLGSFHAEKVDDIDPADFVDPFKYSKRDFLIELFKEYNNLPIMKSLTNFAKVYNDVFVREIPSVMASY